LESHLSAGSSVIALSAAIHARIAPAATSQEATHALVLTSCVISASLTMNQDRPNGLEHFQGSAARGIAAPAGGGKPTVAYEVARQLRAFGVP